MKRRGKSPPAARGTRGPGKPHQEQGRIGEDEAARRANVQGAYRLAEEDLSGLLSEHQPGDTVSVSVERDGQMVTVDIVLAENTSQS